MLSIDVVIPMYNPGGGIIPTIQSVLDQTLESNLACSVYVVDDGSQDGSADYIASTFGDKINVVTLKQNLGRSGARNSGADAGRGVYILFLDSDCVLKDNNCIAAHVANLKGGKDVSFGIVRGRGDSFWQTFQERINGHRLIKAMAGDFMAMTSQNLAVRREVFEKIGEFDQRYTKYGFEDRDWIARLIKAKAKMCLTCDAVVWHDADLTLESVARKMEAAGRYTSGIFMKDHPEEYARMGYSKFDVRHRPILLAAPAALSGQGVSLGKWLGELVIQSSIMPYFMKAFCVKAVSSLAFLRGTRFAV